MSPLRAGFTTTLSQPQPSFDSRQQTPRLITPRRGRNIGTHDFGSSSLSIVLLFRLLVALPLRGDLFVRPRRCFTHPATVDNVVRTTRQRPTSDRWPQRHCFAIERHL